MQVPIGAGTQVDLPPGVTGVQWHYPDGEIHVTLDRLISPEERSALEEVLSQPPVLDVVEVEVPWSPQDESQPSPTEGCPSGS